MCVAPPAVYGLHLAGLLVLGDVDNARFLWKRIPQGVREAAPELRALWAVGQCLWRRERAAAAALLRSGTWSPHIRPLAERLLVELGTQGVDVVGRAYGTIRLHDAAAHWGMAPEAALGVVRERGWGFDESTGVVSPRPPAVAPVQRTSLEHLRQLTDSVVHLEQ
eukprot:Opistho-1_new@101400